MYEHVFMLIVLNEEMCAKEIFNNYSIKGN